MQNEPETSESAPNREAQAASRPSEAAPQSPLKTSSGREEEPLSVPAMARLVLSAVSQLFGSVEPAATASASASASSDVPSNPASNPASVPDPIVAPAPASVPAAAADQAHGTTATSEQAPSRWAEQLADLRAMGFTASNASLETLLDKHGGVLSRAVDDLLAQGTA